MTLLKIGQIGHPVLWEVARPVLDPLDPAVIALAEDMLETMADAHGLGLAAPQVHRSLRIIAVLPIASRADLAGDVAPRILINPELEPIGEEQELDIEGCLSVPQLRGMVPRAARVRWRALDRVGRPLEGEAQGLHARILQHEVDHLDGILFLSRMGDLRQLATLEHVDRLRTQVTDGDPA